MRPQTRSITGTGTTSPTFLDYRQTPFSVGIACAVTGTVTYTLEHTLDDVADFADVTDYVTNATWFPSSDPTLVAATTNQDSNYAAPIRASQVNVTAGTGTVDATWIQGNNGQ